MARKRSFIRRLISGLWLTVSLLYSLLFLFILIAVAGAVYFATQPTMPIVHDNSVLVIAPEGNLAEQDDGVGGLINGILHDQGPPTIVRDLVDALDRARDDSRIKAVLLKLDDMGGAQPGQIQDVLAAIDRFKKSGKRVIAWSDSYDQTRYELASHADAIDLDPLGYVLLTGYGTFRNYYKEGLDKLGVKVNVFRVGKYKSYVEPFTRNSMSEPAKAQDLKWMGSLWDIYRQTVTADGDLTPDDIDAYIQDFATHLKAQGGNAAQLAKQAGLISNIRSFRQVRSHLIDQYGEASKTHSFTQIDTMDYLLDTDRASQKSDKKKSTLALVTVAGEIVDGESMSGYAGGDTIARLIDDARTDDQVKGLLLRVNSPGGSVTAAEKIRRAVVAFGKTGRPVVVSMSGMAASGGYWISMNANQIWAEPSTITGSIGIFAMIPTFGDTLAKIGIHSDGVGTTNLSGIMRLDKPLSAQAKTILQAGVDHGYAEFTGKVAAARGMSRDDVNEIAQGRVWSGQQAKVNGLVDELGGITQATSALAHLAGLKGNAYQIQSMQPGMNWIGTARELLTSKIEISWLPNWLSAPTEKGALAALDAFNDPRHLYARCFCTLDTQPGSAAIP